MKWKKLLLIGDSNTQYGYSVDGQWVAQIADKLQRKCDVINRGLSGYNTNQIRLLLPHLFEEFDPKYICGVIIMLGTNDSTQITNKLQHVDLEKYRENIKFIIDYAIGLGVRRDNIILISPARIHRESLNKDSTFYDHLVVGYARSCSDIAKEKNILFVDFYEAMIEYGDSYKEFLRDGVHLSARGSELLFDRLWPVIDKNIASDLGFNYTYWLEWSDDEKELSKLNQMN